MAEFRRQPEWQQDANRHSTLRDPVLTVKPISRFDYTARRQMTAIDHALVFVTAKGSYDVYIPPHRPSRSDAATRRYTSVYEVDMGSHPVQLDLELPSDDDAFSFGATADLTWRVADPIAYVASGERDVPTRLTRELHQFARPVSRRFPIEDSPSAERAVQQAVETGGFAAGIGLAVTCVVRLRLDDEAIAHRKRQRTLRYESEMLDPEHEFRLRQARLQHELEFLHQQQNHQLITEKINFYQYHLQHGGVGAWALHLAQHPEDTQLVVGSIQRDQLSIIKTQLELIAGDTLEDFQKAESARSTLRAVNDLIQQQTSPAQDGGQAALPAGATPGQPYVPPQPPYPGQPSHPGQPPQPGAQPYAPQPPSSGQPPYAGQAPYAGQPPYAGQAAPPPAPPQQPYSPAPQDQPPAPPYGRQQPPGAPYGPPQPPSAPYAPPPPYAAAGPTPVVPPAPGTGEPATSDVPPQDSPEAGSA
ncbi:MULTISPECIES: PE-PGRS family protein [unclassified Streptomyces]|uniref:PE-PGRS family protein n=1 Tax=unclassified Streptomyces TaxID=2593676 RepID=UPI002E7FEF3E|nr:PE-PGRS family protein [Streptomyces sp. NBC_00589]WTI36957.1 PE-PGRS family protein [Streptomyces sp. NBC_00775]WUB29367.1 PE-PGRS family protein [Streptomyces sp. NBC_00589]